VDSEGLKHDDSSLHVCPLLRHQEEINHKVKTHRNSPSAIRCNAKQVDCGTELLRSKVISTPSNYHNVKPVTAQLSPILQDITINHPSSKLYHQRSGDCDLESACTAKKTSAIRRGWSLIPQRALFRPHPSLPCRRRCWPWWKSLSSIERMREAAEDSYCDTAGSLASDQTGGACTATLE